MSVLNARLLAGVASLALSALALPGAATAASVYGSGAILTNRNCPPEATSCVGPRNFTQYAGGMGVGFSTSADIPGGASAAAAVSFGDDYLPTVKVGSQAGAETRTGASAVAFRSFTYQGDAAIDLALNGALHFVTSGDPAPGEEAGDGLFNVRLSLLPLSAIAAFGPGTTGEQLVSNFNLSETECGTGAIAATSYFGLGATGDNNVSLGLSEACGGGGITLQTGDQFVVVAFLQAISNRGGFINAMNTFTVQYDEEKTVYSGTTDKVGLATLQQTVSGAVPEPGTWALMIGGFGLAGAALRRRRGALAH